MGNGLPLVTLFVQASHTSQSGFFSQYSLVHSSKFSEHELGNKMNSMQYLPSRSQRVESRFIL